MPGDTGMSSFRVRAFVQTKALFSCFRSPLITQRRSCFHGGYEPPRGLFLTGGFFFRDHVFGCSGVLDPAGAPSDADDEVSN